jgi:enoyl-CoA hydratase
VGGRGHRDGQGLLHRRRPAAYEYARRIAENAPLAVFATKQSAIEGLSLGLEEAFDNEARHTEGR